MDANTILNKLRLRGIEIAAIGNAISLAPKRLVNDQMVAFIRKHKLVLLTSLYQEEDKRQIIHRERKRSLHPGRLQVLKIIVRSYLKSGIPGRTAPTDREIEEYIDWILRQHDYDIEDAITTYRNIIREPVLVCECGYLPPFCSCGISVQGTVTCNQCENFTP